MPTSPRSPLRPAVLLVSLWLLLTALTERLTASATKEVDRGSVTLEQVAIAAGLLAVAIAAVAVIGKAVTNYTDLLE